MITKSAIRKTVSKVRDRILTSDIRLVADDVTSGYWRTHAAICLNRGDTRQALEALIMAEATHDYEIARFTKERQPRKRLVQIPFEKFLTQKGWQVFRTHGNAFQSGLPDDFACHKHYGHRWIEFKLPNMVGSRYTVAQLETFPKLSQGSGVWVITAATDYQYRLLMRPPNWTHFLKELK